MGLLILLSEISNTKNSKCFPFFSPQSSYQHKVKNASYNYLVPHNIRLLIRFFKVIHVWTGDLLSLVTSDSFQIADPCHYSTDPLHSLQQSRTLTPSCNRLSFRTEKSKNDFIGYYNYVCTVYISRLLTFPFRTLHRNQKKKTTWKQHRKVFYFN